MAIPTQLQQWSQKRLAALQEAAPSSVILAYQQAAQALTEQEQSFFTYLCACLPFSDYAEKDTPAILADYLHHGMMLYSTSPFCQNIPLDMFLEYILQPRVNNERLEPCRTTLYTALQKHVQGKNTLQAILAVNYWCCEEASYMASDGRTAPPLTVMRAAKGRCGEESTFAVHALRSVGIPARQVYSPLWAHTDDNHAWVEVYCDGEWQYLGACEPEEVLNRGWFTQSASRAVLVHSRTFGLPPQGEVLTDRFGMSYQTNQLERYAKGRALAVTVLYNGQPVQGATVDFELLNYAQLAPIASLTTSDQGVAALYCGYGSLHIRAFFEDMAATALAGPDAATVTLHLTKTDTNTGWQEFTTYSPPVQADAEKAVPPELLEQGTRKLAAANAKREEKIAGFYNQKAVEPVLTLSQNEKKLREVLLLSRGNLQELVAFLQHPVTTPGLSSKEIFALKERLLFTLAEKDLYDITASLLVSHLCGAAQYAKAFSQPVFDEGILCPRIGLETITLWRDSLPSMLTPEQRDAFTANPQALWQYLCQFIQAKEALEYPTLITTPATCLSTGVGNTASQRVLFVAICRTLGIPAKLREADGTPLYWQSGSYHPVENAAQTTCVLTLNGGTIDWRYEGNWTLARLINNRYQTLQLQDLAWAGSTLTISLEAGSYRLLCRNRLPNGDQLANTFAFTLAPEEHKTIGLYLQEASADQMLQQIALPAFPLIKEGQQYTPQGAAMYFWLHPTAEPTEHILNELYIMCEDFAPLAQSMVFILPPNGTGNPLVQKVLSAIPNITIAQDEERKEGKILARRMFQDPDTLPLVLLTNSEGKGGYAICGYNVGTAEMLHKLWKVQQKIKST